MEEYKYNKIRKRLLSNIKEIVFLGGRLPDEVLKFSFSDIIFTDFNIAQDVRATQVVLNDSNIPITFISFSLSSSTTYTRAQVDSLQDQTGQKHCPGVHRLVWMYSRVILTSTASTLLI